MTSCDTHLSMMSNSTRGTVSKSPYTQATIHSTKAMLERTGDSHSKQLLEGK